MVSEVILGNVLSGLDGICFSDYLKFNHLRHLRLPNWQPSYFSIQNLDEAARILNIQFSNVQISNDRAM